MIVVVILFIFGNPFVDTDTSCDGKAAEVIGLARLLRGNKITEATIRFAIGLLLLLAQVTKRSEHIAATVICKNFDIIADTVGREDTDNRPCL